MAKQKKRENTFSVNELIVLDSIVVKKVMKDKKKMTFVEIDGDKLFEQVDFGAKHPIATGKDENGYPVRYSVRFTDDADVNKDKLEAGIYEVQSENIWIDDRDPEKLILRIGKLNAPLKCYYTFKNDDKDLPF